MWPVQWQPISNSINSAGIPCLKIDTLLVYKKGNVQDGQFYFTHLIVIIIMDKYFVVLVSLACLAQALPQSVVENNPSEKGLKEVIESVENALPPVLQEPFKEQVDSVNASIQNVINDIKDNITGEYESSVLPAVVEQVGLYVQDENSPIHFVLDYLPSWVQEKLPAQARTGPLGVAVAGVVVTVAALFLLPVTYAIGYFLGKYFVAPAVLPFTDRSQYGRSLLDFDPKMLENLTENVMTAVETYNLLQSLKSNFDQ